MRKGFTLLELLLVIAIIAALAGIIVFALRPAVILDDARETETVSNASDLEKAIRSYIIENLGALPASVQNIESTGIYDLCKQGENIGCINLDQLLTSNDISEIPIDTRYSTTHTTGYMVNINKDTSDTKVYTRREYEEVTRYCPPGDICAPPVAEWRLDENGGTVTINDSSSNGLTGTMNGSMTESDWVEGKSGSALEFDGVDDMILIPDNDVLDLTTAATFEAWINLPTAPDTGDHIIDKHVGTGNQRSYEVRINPAMRFSVEINADGTSGTSVSLQSDDVITTNTWNHIAAVFSNSVLTLYVNGKRQATTATLSDPDLYVNNAPLSIGGDNDGTNSNMLNGMIDEVKIYNYARSPLQVAWDYNRGMPLAHWEFDEASGTIASDSSGNGLTGTLNGPTWVAGKYGNSLNFDGSNDFINISDPGTSSILDFASGEEITISLWVKPDYIPTGFNYITAVSKGLTDGIGADLNYSISFGNTSDISVCFSDISDVFICYNASDAVSVGDWQYILMKHKFGDASSTQVYINGIAISGEWNAGNGNTAPNVTNESLWIGAIDMGGGDATEEEFSGQIDDLRIYNYLLNPSQIMHAMHER